MSKKIIKTIETEVLVCENCDSEGAVELHCHKCGQEICQNCSVRVKIKKPDQPQQEVVYYDPKCWKSIEKKIFPAPKKSKKKK